MRILLTGATGFVGRRLHDSLLQKGLDVRAAVRTPGEAREGSGGEQVVVGALERNPDLQRAVEGVQVVVHLAGRAHVMRERAADALEAFREVNVTGTTRLAAAAARSGVRRMVFVSSIKVNGESTGTVPFRARDVPAPVDPYGISKWEAEQALRRIERDTGMEVVVVRPPLVYGPGVKGNLRSLLHWIDRGLPLPFGACENSRSLIGLDNLVNLLMSCALEPAAAGGTFLAADGVDLSTPELMRRMGEALGRRPRLLRVPPALIRVAALAVRRRGFYDRLCGSLQVDISETRRILGWTPPVSIDDEMLRMARAYRNREGQA